MFILDGAIGTELARRGANTNLPLWSANALVDDPGLVRTLHEEYIAAGADLITANTFRTTPRTFRRAGLPDRSAELTQLAVALANEARNAFPGRTVKIAGSMGPLEDCYHPERVPPDDALAAEHALHAQRLAEAGVDMLLLETMGTSREAEAACKAAVSTGVPTIVSFLCDAGGNLYDGKPLEEAVRRVEPYHPYALSINCMSPRIIDRAVERLRKAASLPFGVYANVGMPGEEREATMQCDVEPEEYAAFAGRWIDLGAIFVGGCCGTTPEYVRRIRDAFPPAAKDPWSKGKE
ncbi:MAG: homocysteine S-methyltransferase family protein [Bacteroidota bacterium]